MLKLKLLYFGHLMQRAGSLQKTVMLGKIEGKRRGEGMEEGETVALHHQLNGHEQGTSGGQGNLADCSLWGHKELDMT